MNFNLRESAIEQRFLVQMVQYSARLWNALILHVVSSNLGRYLRSATMYAGLWMAPVKVGEALKGGRLIARVMASAGFRVVPLDPSRERPSFITAIELGSAAAMQAFCTAVQQNSPVGSYILPEPGELRSVSQEKSFAAVMSRV
jgi:cystathionine beta-lyase family protein involved in aluminum resistance